MKRYRCTWIPALTILMVILSSASVEAQTRVKQGLDGHRSSYTSEPKKRQPIEKHDIVLILVSEETTGGVDAGLDTKRKTELSMLIDAFVRFEGGHLEPSTKPQPEIEYEAEAKTTAKGKTNRKDSIRTRVAARVIDVLPNGNVRLEARRERRINDEVTTITLSGEAMVKDVSVDHQIMSDRLADLKIQYSGEGPVSNRTGQTWLGRLVDWIWPF